MVIFGTMFSRSVRSFAYATSRGISKKSYIQPIAATHPELLHADEIMPFTKIEEFSERRRKLANLIRNSPVKCGSADHLVFIPSATKQYASAKIPYVFRQNSDFLYFTGCFEPDCVLVIHVSSEGERSFLFLPPSDYHSELWEGPKFQPSDAQDLFGIDCLTTDNFEKIVTDTAKRVGACNVWFEIGLSNSALTRKFQNVVLSLESGKTESPVQFFHELRVIKTESEINLMKKAGDIGALALSDTMMISKPDIEEFRLWTEVEYRSKLRGAQFLAYPPVVAGGSRGNIIHYIYNNNKVANGDLVLMDAGCEYFGYASDITRTWPVNGKFSTVQKALYEAVLDAQQDLIKETCEVDTLDAMYMSMCRLLGKNLSSLGLIKCSSEKDIYRAVGKYCPHHVSHFLGMDVHDVPKAPKNMKFKPGVILTVEPGVYVQENDLNSPKEFRGLGIRIEDDILITKDGPVVLSEKCPKTVSELEKIIGSNQ